MMCGLRLPFKMQDVLECVIESRKCLLMGKEYLGKRCKIKICTNGTYVRLFMND
jgi:hypothetical protein